MKIKIIQACSAYKSWSFLRSISDSGQVSMHIKTLDKAVFKKAWTSRPVNTSFIIETLWKEKIVDLWIKYGLTLHRHYISINKRLKFGRSIPFESLWRKGAGMTLHWDFYNDFERPCAWPEISLIWVCRTRWGETSCVCLPNTHIDLPGKDSKSND